MGWGWGGGGIGLFLTTFFKVLMDYWKRRHYYAFSSCPPYAMMISCLLHPSTPHCCLCERDSLCQISNTPAFILIITWSCDQLTFYVIFVSRLIPISITHFISEAWMIVAARANLPAVCSSLTMCINKCRALVVKGSPQSLWIMTYTMIRSCYNYYGVFCSFTYLRIEISSFTNIILFHNYLTSYGNVNFG